MMSKPPTNGTKSGLCFRDLEECQILTKTGNYNYDFGTRQYSCSKGYLYIHEIDQNYNSLDDFFDVIHPLDQPDKNNLALKWKTIFSNHQCKEPFEMRYKIIARKTGRIKLIRDIITPYFKDKKLIGIKGAIQDITDDFKFTPEIKLVAEASSLKIAKHEMKSRLPHRIFDQAQKFANIGCWRLILNTGEVYCSGAILKIFGFNNKKDKVSYDDFFDVIHAGDKTKVAEAINKCLSESIPVDLEYRLHLKSGKIRWVHAKGTVLRDKLGKPTEMYGVAREITDTKTMLLALEQSKELYRLLAEVGQEMICLHSLDGYFVYASPALETLWGYHPDKLSRTLKSIDLIHPDDKDAFTELLNRVMLQKDEVISGRFRFRHRNGKFIWCEKNMKAVLNSKGEITSIRTLTRNIESQISFENKLKETNAQLERALIDLKEASKTKENFLSVMSHEIRTPLNSVIGLSNLLIRRNPREDQIEIVKTLKNSADNLMHLVNDILDFNKIRSGKVELELLPFNLTAFLQQQYAAFKLSALDKNLNLDFKVDPLIPEWLIGDVTRLNQIFTNLLTNAIKFTHEGYVKLTVQLQSVSEKTCSLSFTIEDTGVGISSDKLELIFEPFHQSDLDISRKYGGTGLGLSIVKSLVNLMNGKLKLTSTPGAGSSFCINLDFSIHIPKPEIIQLQSGTTINPPVETGKKQNVLNVLYVEDVESNRFLIENLLSDNSINCVAVSSGKAALRFTLRKKFDVILMDIQMPVMDGYKTTEKIRLQPNGKNKKTSVIAFTAEPYSTTLKNKTIQHDIQYVITKPFNPDVLIERIRLLASTSENDDYLFTFAFYEQAFGDKKQKLKQIKKAVINDFTRFKKMLTKHDKAGNLVLMREEIHRIRPIAKNLSCSKLIFVLEKFRLYEEYNANVRLITRESVRIVEKLLLKLSAL